LTLHNAQAACVHSEMKQNVKHIQILDHDKLIPTDMIILYDYVNMITLFVYIY